MKVLFRNHQLKLRFLLALLFTAVLASMLIVPTKSVLGAELTQRKVTILSPVAGATTNYSFSFNMVTPGSVGSVQLTFCSNSPFITAPCSAPSGLDIASTILAAQTGETGFSIHPNTTTNNLIITRPSVAITPQAVSYSFNNAVNPSTANETVYVRISTYSTDDATGGYTDNGSVAFSTSNAIGTAGFVPPFMNICVGLNVASNCSSVFGGVVDFGELSKVSNNVATSQFAVACNDVLGYSVYIIGTTLTAGNNIIPNLSTPQSVAPGTSGFGINLKSNGNPVVGADVTGAGSGSPSANYNISNNFTFNNGDLIASSPISSDYNVYTVSYLANVSQSQPPGIYTSTFTFVSVALF